MLLKALFLFLLVVVAQFSLTHCAECHGGPDPNAKENLNPIIDESLVFVKQIQNAKLYTIGSGDDTIDVVHLWGTPYEMGFAHGTLQKDKMLKLVVSFWNYLEEKIMEEINKTSPIYIQPDFLKEVTIFGLDVALDLEMLVTDKFTGSYFFDELRGMSDATGVDLKLLKRMHLAGELTKGQCSMFGAWGQSVPDQKSLLQLRGLDWFVDGGLQNFPEIVVYHPNKGNGHDFANIAWSGFVGSIMGYSSTRVAISEIGVYFTDPSYGNTSRVGIPFSYLLRDIIQFDDTIDDAINRIQKAHRTCDLILGVGDGKSNRFNAIQYSHSVANVISDYNLRPVADWHPPFKNIVYYGKDWNCPGFNIAMAKQLTAMYGNLTAESSVRNMTSIVQTGTLTTVYYDYGKETIYVANARADGEKGPKMAYDRSFVKVYMPPLFAEQPPKFDNEVENNVEK